MIRSGSGAKPEQSVSQTVPFQALLIVIKEKKKKAQRKKGETREEKRERPSPHMKSLFQKLHRCQHGTTSDSKWSKADLTNQRQENYFRGFGAIRTHFISVFSLCTHVDENYASDE